MKEWLLKYKKTILILTIPLLILGGTWHIFSDKVAKALQDSLAETAGQKLNGRLQVGSIDLSLLSWIRIRDVALYDQSNNLVAKSPVIAIKYRWRSLTSGNLAMSGIEVVTIQGGEVWLKNERQRWNWEGMTKVENSAADFNAKVLITDSTVHIANDVVMQTIEAVDGTLDFTTYPAAVEVALKGRASQAKLALTGKWGETLPGELMLQTDGFDIAKLSGLLPAAKEIRLEKGILKNAKVVAKRGENSTVQYRAEGSFSALTVTGQVDISEGQGNFSADETGLQFNELSLKIFGQKAAGKGNILLRGDKQMLDFELNLPDVDPASLFSGLAVQRPLSAEVKIAGPLAKPLITGSFKIPQVTVSNMSVSEVTGNMRYDDGRLTLQQVRGAAFQGKLSLSGEVITASESYELKVAGSGMNSSALTDKDVQGPLEFSGHVSGNGSGATTKGEFIIRDGKAYGVAFQTLTGNFIRRGESTDISGVIVNTAFGTFYPEQLSRAALDKLSQHNIPTSREEVQKAVADTLMKKLFR